MAGGLLSLVGIDRKSLIKFKPRTFDFRQIKFAREATLYVLNTKSMEEAFQIFTQGFEPLMSVATIDDDATKIEIEEFGEDKEDQGNYIVVVFKNCSMIRIRAPLYSNKNKSIYQMITA